MKKVVLLSGAMNGKDETLNSELGSEIILSSRSKVEESNGGIDTRNL